MYICVYVYLFTCMHILIYFIRFFSVFDILYILISYYHCHNKCMNMYIWHGCMLLCSHIYSYMYACTYICIYICIYIYIYPYCHINHFFNSFFKALMMEKPSLVQKPTNFLFLPLQKVCDCAFI